MNYLIKILKKNLVNPIKKVYLSILKVSNFKVVVNYYYYIQILCIIYYPKGKKAILIAKLLLIILNLYTFY
jgi:hypothetical protein